MPRCAFSVQPLGGGHESVVVDVELALRVGLTINHKSATKP
jgi:hypothetical protein